MVKFQKYFFLILLFSSCTYSGSDQIKAAWEISVIPSSVRLDPSTNEILDFKFDAVSQEKPLKRNILDKNWIYDGSKVTLHAARGEYISFQLVLTNNTESALKAIQIENGLWKLKPQARVIQKPHWEKAGTRMR